MDVIENAATSSCRKAWGPLAPCDHVLQVYATDGDFLDALEGFVAEGLEAGEAVVIVATASHRQALLQRLGEAGVDLEAALASDALQLVSAQDTLERFMLRGAPDEALLRVAMADVIQRARGSAGRKLRVFGEMVAMLWARGNQPAAVRLECLWSRLQREEGFPLFCAYPKFSFTDDLVLSVDAICQAHTRILD